MVNNLPSIGNPGSSAQIGLLTPSMTAKNVYVVTYFKDGADTTFDAYCTLLSGNGSWGSYRIMGNTGQANFYNTSHFNNGGTYRNGSTTNALSGALPMPATLYKFKSTALRLQPYALGYNQAEVSRDWLGSYCEFIFTDGTEDLATEQKIEGYLAHKWGLTAHLPADHPYKSQAPGGSSAVANLDGTVSDANGNSTSTIWSDTGTGTGNGSITIGNTSAVDTTATFTETGTYILRLTANDGFDTAHDEVTITVIDDPGKPTYTLTVTNGTGGGDYSAGANVAITADAPAAGYRFVNWTTSDGGSFADANTASTTYTMPANSAEVIANYALNNQPVVDAGFDQTVALTEAIPWTPAELSTMAWYDASDANTITIVAGKVSAWADKSQNGHGLSQATESARPVTGTRTINGLNALDFAPGLYLFNDSAAVVSGNPDLMIVSVQVLDQTVTGNDAILILGNGTGGTTAGIMGGTNGYSWRFFDGYEAYGSVNTGSAEIQIGIRAAGSNYTGSEMWLNGVQLSATAGGSTNTPNIASGIWASGKGGYMDGAVGEMIVLQDSSISSRQKVEGYLAHKWGLAGNLPTGHLYKSAAPLTSGQMVTVNLDGTVSDADGEVEASGAIGAR